MTRLIIVATCMVYFIGCAKCELRQIHSCEFEPAHTQTYIVNNCYTSNNITRCIPQTRTRYIPDRWFLAYTEGWNRQVDKVTCEREGSVALHRPRYEFRQGRISRKYTFVDSPVMECVE